MTTHYEKATALLERVDQVDELVAEQLGATPNSTKELTFVEAARANALALVQVHATLALADELRLAREAVSTCPHGTTGLCMSCLTRTLEGALPR